MKKILIMIITLVLISTVSYANECTDTDGGFEPYVKGEISINGVFDSSDNCMNDIELMERNCYNGDGKSGKFVCPEGCNDGRCLGEPKVETETCKDNDGGINYYEGTDVQIVKGEDVIKNEWDQCLPGNKLREMYCENGEFASEEYQCPGECYNTHCLKNNCDSHNLFIIGISKDDNYLSIEFTNSNVPENDIYVSFGAQGGSQGCDIKSMICEGEKCMIKTSCYYDTSGEGRFVKIEDKSCPLTHTFYLESGPQNVCKDSDSGIKYMEKGIITLNNKKYSEDTCKDDKILSEYYCGGNSDSVSVQDFGCPNGCENGVCKKSEIKPSIETGPIKIPVEKIADVDTPPEVKEESFLCYGCKTENQCFPLGYRKSGSYCSENNKFEAQKSKEVNCENNFECESNVCINNKCISQNLIQRIIEWFTKLFE